MNEAGTGERGGGESTAVPEPGSLPRPKLRRRPLGYKVDDVDEALDARDSELAELRQDIAALWMAFAQHDRMIRTALEAPLAAPAQELPPREPSPPPDPTAVGDQLATGIAAGQEADPLIGQQLSDLDQVLVAIEMATKTLERTYAEEIGDAEDRVSAPGEGPDQDRDPHGDDADAPPDEDQASPGALGSS